MVTIQKPNVWRSQFTLHSIWRCLLTLLVFIHYRYGKIWICDKCRDIVIPSPVKPESCLPRVLGTLSRVLDWSWSKRWQAGRGPQKNDRKPICFSCCEDTENTYSTCFLFKWQDDWLMIHLQRFNRWLKMTLVFGWWVICHLSSDKPTWSSAENYLAFISRSITLKVGTSTWVKPRIIKAQVFPGYLAVGSFLAKDVRKQFHHMMTSLAGGDSRCRFRDGKGAVCLIMQHQNKTVSDKSCQTVYVHKTEDSDEANITPISSSANPWNVQWILAWRYKSCRLHSQAFAQSKARDPTSKCHNQPGGLATEIVCQHNSNSMRTPLTFIKINVDQWWSM